MSFSKYLVMVAVASASVAIPPSRSFAQTAPQTPVTAKSSLETRIEAIFDNDAELSGHDIDVDVDGTVVTLKGTVATAAERERAERLAKLDGVTRVVNEIKIDPAAKRMSRADRAAEKTKAGTNKAIDATKGAAEKTVDKTKEIAGKTADKTKEIAGKTADKSKEVGKTTAEKSKAGAGVAKDAGKDIGQKTKEAASTTGEAITDGWITTKVKAKMVDERLLKGSDINVDTNDHVVTLKGTVASEAGKARAEEIARTTDGVKRVVNQLVVKP